MTAAPVRRRDETWCTSSSIDHVRVKGHAVDHARILRRGFRGTGTRRRRRHHRTVAGLEVLLLLLKI